MASVNVLVLGFTGNQGSAVVDHLLAAETSFNVYGLTRDPESETARAFSDEITVVQGDLLDPQSFEPVVRQVDAIFCVTNFWTAGYEGHVEQGKNAADLAAAHGIDHFVYSSVGSANRDTGIPHFDATYAVERHIERLDLPATIVRPVAFMQNFETQTADILDGTLAFPPIGEGVSLQYIDVDDIGLVATRVLENPEEFVDDDLDIAGDEHTLESAATVFSEVTGTDVAPGYLTPEEVRDTYNDDLATMFEWFNEEGYDADIEALERRLDVEFTTLEEYLYEHEWHAGKEPVEPPAWMYR